MSSDYVVVRANICIIGRTAKGKEEHKGGGYINK